MPRSDCGCIQNLGDGRWIVRISCGKDPDTGKRIRISKTVRGSEKDALALKAAMLVKSAEIKESFGTNYQRYFSDAEKVAKSLYALQICPRTDCTSCFLFTGESRTCPAKAEDLTAWLEDVP